MFIRKKPIIAIYEASPEEIKGDLYLNGIVSNDGKYHSFRCPNEKCGRPLRIGFSECPFCRTKLKWKYPFKFLEKKQKEKNCD